MKRFKNILYVAELDAYEDVFDHAIDLAHQNDARLTVIIIAEPLPPYRYLRAHTREMITRARTSKAQTLVERLRARASREIKIDSILVEDKPFLGVIREVLRNKRDLVIKAVGQSENRIAQMFGTTDMHLLRKCPCPIWFIKPNTNLRRHSVMACIDIDEAEQSKDTSITPLNQTILEVASSLALHGSGECHVVHAWDAIAMKLMSSPQSGLTAEEVAEYVREVQTQHESWLERLLAAAKLRIVRDRHTVVEMHPHTQRGEPQDVIPLLAEKLGIDVLVMGTIGQIGVPGLLIGGAAEGILNKINCSVFTMKPPGFVSPVAA